MLKAKYFGVFDVNAKRQALIHLKWGFCYIYIYIYIHINNQILEKIQLVFNWIFNFASCVSFNF